MRKKKIYKHYYYDELVDDFAGNNINGKQTPKDYQYYNSNWFYRAYKKVCYTLILGIVILIAKCQGIHIKNKKVFKSVDKKQGYFIYGNHTSSFADALTPSVVASPRTTSIVCNPDAISIKGIKHLVKILGAYPIPSYQRTYVNFVKSMKTLIDKGEVVMIYPEAHIWPYYNDIRDFSNASFYYPVKFNAPCFVKTTIYRKTKFGKIKMDVYCDGPFYPDTTLPFDEAKTKLCSQVKEKMKERINICHSVKNSAHNYIKVSDPTLVRTETIEVVKRS